MTLPDGFGQVAPYLVVQDAQPYLDHLCEALGGTITNRKVDGDGVLLNAHIFFGQGSVMVTEGRPHQPATPAYTYLFVDDTDKTYAHALAGGMTSLFAPQDMPYNDRQAGVRDLRGNTWWIAQRLVEGPY